MATQPSRTRYGEPPEDTSTTAIASTATARSTSLERKSEPKETARPIKLRGERQVAKSKPAVLAHRRNPRKTTQPVAQASKESPKIPKNDASKEVTTSKDAAVIQSGKPDLSFHPGMVGEGCQDSTTTPPRRKNDALGRRRCRHRPSRARLSSGDPQPAPPDYKRTRAIGKRDAAHAQGRMPCRPCGQRHASSTTLNPGAAAPASTRDRPAPLSNLPPSARHRNRRLAHQMPRRRAAILAPWHTSATGLQVPAGASAPQLTCHPRWPSAAEPNSDRFWARALDPRPPRDLRAEKKLAAQIPPPPRPRGRRPGLRAPGELQPRAGPDRARPDPDRARQKHRAATTQRCRHRRPPHSPARRRRSSTPDANHRRAAAARGGADGSGAPASNAFTAALPQPPSVTGAAATAAGPAAAAEARRKPGGPAAARLRLPRVARCGRREGLFVPTYDSDHLGSHVECEIRVDEVDIMLLYLATSRDGFAKEFADENRMAV